MALFVFSDAHLGSGLAADEQRKQEKLSELFALIERDGDRVIILGDLFDFWFEYEDLIPKAHFGVLHQLQKLRDKGIGIEYVSGNHDFWMLDFFQKHMGIPVIPDRMETTYGALRLLLIHGDGLAKADGGYRLLKRILRNRPAVWCYRNLLPSRFAYWLAHTVSGKSRTYTARRDHEFAADYSRFAEQQLALGFNAVLIGHLHIPVTETHHGGTYLNTGDFIHHFTYAYSDGRTIELRRLPQLP